MNSGRRTISRITTATLAALLVFAVTPVSGAPGNSSGALPGGADLIGVRTANLQSRGVLTIGLAADYFESSDASALFGDDAAGEYTTIRLGARYGLTPWLEVCADLPARRAAWDETPYGAKDATGLDKPVVGLKLAVPTGGSVLKLALNANVALPLADEMVVDDGDGASFQLAGGSGVDIEGTVLVTADLTEYVPVRLHANAGIALNRSEETGRRFYPDYYLARADGGDASDNDVLVLRGAVEFPGRNVDLFTEFQGDLFNDRDAIALKENPLTVTPGVRVRFGGGWIATGGVGISMSGDDRDTPDFDPHDAYPDWRATVVFAYAWPVFAADTDSDGIPDFRDECPTVAEDLDGFSDEDGCPDLDNDLDGVPDGFDGRPLLMEDYDGFQDEDGVPDLDNDGDGIVDERDMCPDEAEDLDGFEDGDGCPDD